MSYLRGQFHVAVLCGGISSEREVSLGSGKASALALAQTWPTRLIDVKTAAAPLGLRPDRDVVFSTLHGTFGEDGGMQTLLDEAGVIYAGCDAESSALTFDKQRTKSTVAAVGVPTIPGITFAATAAPALDEIVATLGEAVVIKPQCGGSSVGLHLCATAVQIATALTQLTPGEWLAERRVSGREITVGILHGRALPVVEIAPKSGVFDYAAKYTKGLTEYLAPAPLDPAVASLAQAHAEKAFSACGCRDYGRIDFMVTEDGALHFLEINTLPGMKETSLLPMGAQCVGYDFAALVRELMAPARERFLARRDPAVQP
ncbi:D-alanine--D-alanine ligase [Actomonas aquatica]|uniref:D-alanine--D-alanine ligase n=1 Tax=Actomonas aquatica TaxID=2866162 RepID=A0ABZ1CFN8_9BACT|nr:D-alanine--D-alanine ligase [Opitutus sp. WL0086]WRQ89100.1 D-alanine--D-alanine ligase [Opitutus sp. WL0086]